MDFDKRERILGHFRKFVFTCLIICAVILVGLFLITALLARSLLVFILGLMISAVSLLPLFIQSLVVEVTERLTHDVNFSLKLIKKEQLDEKGEEL